MSFFTELLGPEGRLELPMVVWRLAAPLLAASSAPLGGGLGLRCWVVNAQVGADYARLDPDRHLEELAAVVGLSGPGLGMLTAASIAELSSMTDGGVHVDATVGVEHPTWAAADDDPLQSPRPGTINIVAFVPQRLSEAALVNAVVTMTEAKTQALMDSGISGTGTASDAVCVLCRSDGPAQPFGGPRSLYGARLARATYGVVSKRCGTGSYTSSKGDDPDGDFCRRPGTTAI